MYLHKYILVVALLCFTARFAFAQSCQASIVLIERDAHWLEDGLPKRIYDMHITNTHTSCVIRNSISVQINTPPGTHMGYSWGITGGKVKGFDVLSPTQTHAGAGFVLSGHGSPSATILTIDGCDCQPEPTLNPNNPTQLPTEQPPTEQPTEQPTGAPSTSTSGPTPTPSPTQGVTPLPTFTPTESPTQNPTTTPPTQTPTETPTYIPTQVPTQGPSDTPTSAPTPTPTLVPDNDHYYVGMRFLVLTCNLSDVRLNVAKSILNSVGSQYDVVDYGTWGTAPLVLNNTDGSGKYYGIISTIELFCWTAAQKVQIEAYEIQFHVKTVILYSFPYTTNGVTATIGVALTTSDNSSYLTFAPSMEACSHALNFDAHIPIKGVYVYLATVADASLATPALYLNYNGAQYVAAALVTYPDGRTRIEMYVDQADWALYPVLIGTAWLQWVSNGIFAGARRLEFNAHMDDIFMNTGMFDIELGEEGTDETYRITPSDLTSITAWQTDLNNRLPAGSNFTLTFPFNGATVLEKGGYEGDALFLKAKEIRDHFIWESHTWSHPYLDNMTYEEVKAEYTNNDATIKTLFGVADMASIPNFCTKSTVTPSITGLFNPNALRAIKEHGFIFVVGDNSRAELLPANAYHSLHTNVATNGIDGMYIIPRHATNIYYDSSRPDDITIQFNYHYSATLGYNLTFSEVVAKDVDSATASLLAFRHDPFMFHQANLRFSSSGFPDGQSHSLLSYWVDQVIAAVSKYTSLPIKSHKHDDLGQMYLDRENRDACGFSGTLKVGKTTHEVVGMNARSTNNCVYGVSGVKSSGEFVESFETYGSEETTWFSIFFLQEMTAGSNFDVTFTEPVKPL